jgi:hypothetical protein
VKDFKAFLIDFVRWMDDPMTGSAVAGLGVLLAISVAREHYRRLTALEDSVNDAHERMDLIASGG